MSEEPSFMFRMSGCSKPHPPPSHTHIHPHLPSTSSRFWQEYLHASGSRYIKEDNGRQPEVDTGGSLRLIRATA